MGHLVERIENPEIVIGFVSPIGTPIQPSLDQFRKLFSAMNYEVVEVKVTENYKWLSKFIVPKTELKESPKTKRYETYIKYGNQLREEAIDNEIMAATAIQSIVEKRLSLERHPKKRYQKTAYLVHQFKRPEEIALLRSVYGRIFFQVSIYSRREARVDHLARDFTKDEGKPNHNDFRSIAENFVSTDENQSSESFGQRVGKIFHDADFIINKDVNRPNVVEQIDRIFEIIYGSNKTTPTKMEYGMYLAKSAALRTSDLSRQVGAAIFSESGEVVSLGSNEVPKAGGGTYWEDDLNDDREFRRNSDSNDIRKNELMDEVLNVLGVNPADISKKTKEKLGKTSFMDALEYGRIIHAEMCAITDAARLGRSIKKSSLYSTTFPCHMCAKHIVSSGIDNVVFLEPYPKSLAARFHSDSISIEGSERGEYADFDQVEFIHLAVSKLKCNRHPFKGCPHGPTLSSFQRF